MLFGNVPSLGGSGAAISYADNATSIEKRVSVLDEDQVSATLLASGPFEERDILVHPAQDTGITTTAFLPFNDDHDSPPPSPLRTPSPEPLFVPPSLPRRSTVSLPSVEDVDQGADAYYAEKAMVDGIAGNTNSLELELHHGEGLGALAGPDFWQMERGARLMVGMGVAYPGAFIQVEFANQRLALFVPDAHLFRYLENVGMQYNMNWPMH